MSVSTESPESATTEATGIVSELFAGLIGAGVAVGCVLPPILHLVTGPLGPLIGGFVAANKVRPGVRAQLIVAVTVATALSSLIGAALSIAAHVASANELPDWFPATPSRIIATSGVVWTYAGILAMIGTVVRGSISRK